MSGKTYKALVVDDEYWIGENLRNIINWRDYSLQFLEPALNGIEALERIEADSPDIVIADVQMPFLNGVELAKAIKDNYPNIVVIILSGYSHFEYVRDALTAGAIDYILKPLERDNLVSVLSKAMEIISHNILVEKEKETAKNNIDRARSVLQDRELSLLLSSEYVHQRSFQDAVSNLQLRMIGYRLVLVKLQGTRTDHSENSLYSFGNATYFNKKRIGALLSGSCLIFSNIYAVDEYIILSEMSSGLVRQTCAKLIDMEDSPARIAVSRYYGNFTSLKEAYSEAKRTLLCAKCTENRILVMAEDVNGTKIKSRLTNAVEKRLMMAVKRKNRKLTHRIIFEEIGLKRLVSEGWRCLEIEQTLEQCLRILGAYIENDERPEFENNCEMLFEALGELRITDIHSILGQIIDQLCDFSDEVCDDSAKNCVKQAINYIETQYADDLSLPFFSKLFYVEGTYLSRLFKQETGDSIMLYITKKRIEKSVEMMCKEELNLTDISYMVGYDDYTYFSRVFKKIMGMSPRDYKNSIAAEVTI